MTPYKGIEQLPHEGLREEAEGWAAEGSKIVCGEALMIPDNGSGTMYAFYDETKGRGMATWGMTDSDEASDWIEATSLKEVFQKYMDDDS